MSATCEYATQRGECRRQVKTWGDRCWQHGGPIREPDPIGDIAESIGVTHDCADPRECRECRQAATSIWMCSPGHREAWYGQASRRLAVAIKDVCWRAVQYGETEDGDTFAYLVTKGAMHRLIGAAQGAGISASFRADSSDTLPDPAPSEARDG